MKRKYLKTFTGRLIITALLALLQIITFIVTVILLSTYAIPIYVVLTFISLVVVLFVVNRRQNPAYKLVWSIVILTFPVFGGLMYIMASLQSSTHRFKKKALKANSVVSRYTKQNPEILSELRKTSPYKARHAAYLSEKGNFPLYKNVSAVYIASGEEYYEKLKIEIQKAKKFIFIECFIIQEGIMWDNILKLLIAKIKEGVEVRIIWDGMGCMSTLPKNYDKILESLGFKVMIFNPFIPLATIIQNNRDHRKIIVIDGDIAFTGGINLADEYINAYEKFGHWKDSAVMLRGDAVNSFTMMFLGTWYQSKPVDNDITAFLHCPSPGEFVIQGENKGYCQPYSDSPLDNEAVGEQVYFNIVNKAKDYFYLTTPYLIPDHELITSLCFAAKSGVDVRIITPHIPDKWYAFHVTRSFYGELIESGVRIYEYTPGFIHQKICISDDDTAVIGTINLDYRSLYLHFECALMLYDSPIISDVKRDFLNTLSLSQEITPEIYKKTISRKILLTKSILRILSPLL